jgi:DNA repair protein RAD50
MTSHGERISMSTKVAELDRVVPQQLGVSPAILESVIFCHQDESLWPMSEPSKLKVKFDEIFEAQKYTKAIDVLVKLRKTHQINLNGLTIHEANFKDLKDKAERVQKKMFALEKDIDELRVKEASLKQQMSDALEVSKEMNKKKNEALLIINELQTKESQAEGLEHTIATLSSTLEELQETDEWLQATLDQYQERLQQYDEEENRYKVHFAELQASVNASRQELSKKQAELGQYHAEKQNYERNIQNRVQLVKDAARSHSLRGYDDDLDESQVQEFVRRMNKLSQEKERELDRVTAATREESKQAQVRISELENRQATRNQEKVSSDQHIKSNRKKMEARQLEINGIRIDEGARATLDEKYRSVQDLLERANSNWESVGWEAKRKIEIARQHELQAESKRLKDQLFQSNNLANERAQLEHTKKLAKESQRALDTLISVHKPSLDKLIGGEWIASDLDREFQTVLDRKAQVVNEAKRRKDGAEKDLDKTLLKLDAARSLLKAKNEEIQKCESVVLNSIILADTDKPLTSIDDYPKELESLEAERDKAREDIEGAKFYTEYFKKALGTLNDVNCCRLCERPFTDKKEKASITQKLNKLLSKYVDTELAEELKQCELDLQRANKARSQYDTYQSLWAEMPKLEAEVKRLEIEKASRDTECEYEDRSLRDAEASQRDIDTLSNDVNKIARYCSEVLRHEQEIARLSSQQKLSGSSMSIEEMQEQMATCDEQLRILQTKIDKISADKEKARSEIQKLELQEGNLRSEIASADSKLEKKQSLLKVIEELRENNAHLDDIIRVADNDLEAIEPELAKWRAQYEDIQQRGQLRAKDVQAEKGKLAQTVNKLKLVGDSINVYVDSGGAEKLSNCERAIKIVEQDQEGIQKEIQEVTNKAKALGKKIAESGQTKSSILENIRYRNVLKQLETVKREISELKTRKADEDYDQFNREASHADLRYQKFLAERGPVVGAMRSKDDELTEKMAEWDTEYKNASHQYREMHVKVETTKAAIEDMAKCKLALDHAIMKYHSIKMEEINAIAGELWRSTYQGTDVDTIMIRSESESASAQKNYNYRVVMVKQDTEMDMRGRCSAGQRVLASIIIRLALAECFGVNCGVSFSSSSPCLSYFADNIGYCS